MKKRLILQVVFFVLTIAFTTACGGDEAKSEPEKKIEEREKKEILDEADEFLKETENDSSENVQ